MSTKPHCGRAAAVVGLAVLLGALLVARGLAQDGTGGQGRNPEPADHGRVAAGTLEVRMRADPKHVGVYLKGTEQQLPDFGDLHTPFFIRIDQEDMEVRQDGGGARTRRLWIVHRAARGTTAQEHKEGATVFWTPPAAEADDNYAQWFVQTRQRQAGLNRATAGALVTLGEIAAMSALERQGARHRLELIRSLEQPDDPRANEIHTRLLLQARQGRVRMERNTQLQYELLENLERGWFNLQQELQKRLGKEKDHPERVRVLEAWLRRVSEQVVAVPKQLAEVAQQDQETRRRHIRTVEEAVRKAVDGGDARGALDGLHRLFALAAFQEALVSARTFVATFPDDPDGKEILKDVELNYLEGIRDRLCKDRGLVNALLKEWGFGLIDPETGDWVKPTSLKFRKDGGTRLLEIWIRNDQLFEETRDVKTRATEQILGITLLMQLRRGGVRLQDALRDGAPAFKDLPPSRVRYLQGALAAAVNNPDVKLLMENGLPQPEARVAYFDVSRFHTAFEPAAEGKYSWVFVQLVGMAWRHVIFPHALGLASNLVLEVPGVKDLVRMIGTYALDKPAQAVAPWVGPWLNRYDQFLQDIPGWTGVAARVAEPYLREKATEKLADTVEAALAGDEDAGVQGHQGVILHLVVRFLKGYSTAVVKRAGEMRSVGNFRRKNRLDRVAAAEAKAMIEARDTNDRYQGLLNKAAASLKSGTVDPNLLPALRKAAEESGMELEAFDKAEAATALVPHPNKGVQAILQRDGSVPGTTAVRDALARSSEGLAKFATWVQQAAKQGGKLLPDQERSLGRDIEAYTGNPARDLAEATNQETTQAQDNAKTLREKYYENLRDGSPSDELRDMVNTGIVQPQPGKPKPDPILLGKVTEKRLRADHIVPYDEVIKWDGFDELPWEAQLKILNNPENFVGLTEAANGSKGKMSFTQWEQYLQRNGIAYNKDFLRVLKEKEKELEPLLKRQLGEALAKHRAGRSP